MKMVNGKILDGAIVLNTANRFLFCVTHESKWKQYRRNIPSHKRLIDCRTDNKFSPFFDQVNILRYILGFNRDPDRFRASMKKVR
jgi:hypothetical protein